MTNDLETMFGSRKLDWLVKKAYATYLAGLANEVQVEFSTFRAGFAYGITSVEVEIPGAYRFEKKQEKENDDAKTIY